MSIDFKKMNDFFDSAEGQESIKQWKEKMESEDKRLADRIERFHNLYKDRIDEVMERLIARYDSDVYVNREYKLGYEPREPLNWFMLEYAKTHGRICDNEKYYNDFTGEAHYIGSYVIQVMNGQGSVIRIDKVEQPVEVVDVIADNLSPKEVLEKELETAKRMLSDTEDTTRILVQQKNDLIKLIHREFDHIHNYQAIIEQKERDLKALDTNV